MDFLGNHLQSTVGSVHRAVADDFYAIFKCYGCKGAHAASPSTLASGP